MLKITPPSESPLIVYLKNHHDQFEIEEPNEIDQFIFTILSYTKFENIREDIKFPITIKKYSELYPIDDTSKGGIYISLLSQLARNKRYQNVAIIDFMKSTSIEEEKQFAYMAFRLPNKNIFVSYRGTDATLVGWKEDLNMAYLAEIPAQKEALDRLNKLMNKYPFSKFYLGGHSKGGALAIFAYQNLSNYKKKRIISVMDLDSPGLKDDNLNEEEIKKIHTYIPRVSIVGRIYYKKQRVSVVSSINKNITQHDAFSWEIEDDKLKILEELDTGLKLEESSLNKILNNISPWEAEYFINTVYQLINEYNIQDVDDILSLKMIIKIVSKIRILDKDNFTVFKDVFKKIINPKDEQ